MAAQGGSNRGKGKDKPASGLGPGNNNGGNNNNPDKGKDKPPYPPEPGFRWERGPNGGWFQTDAPKNPGTGGGGEGEWKPPYPPKDGYHWEPTPGGGFTQVPNEPTDGGTPEDNRGTAPGAAWQWDGSKWVRPPMPKDGKPYTWDDNLGWQVDTGLMNSRTNARDYMVGLFKQFGFDDADIKSLTTLIDGWVQQGLADAGTEPILMKFRDTDIYKKRFAGMAELIGRGQAISEAEYIQLESSYRNVMQNYGLPDTFYDSPSDYARLIGAGLSVNEVEQRVVAAKQALNPLVAQELQQYYGVDSGTAMAYLLGLTDAKGVALESARNQEQIRSQSRAAQIGAAAERAGFGMDKTSAEALGATAVGATVDPFNIGTMANLQGTFDQARREANRQGTLAAIDSETYSDQEALQSAFGDDQAKLASEKRARRERARFSGSSGVGGTSLSVSRNL